MASNQKNTESSGGPRAVARVLDLLKLLARNREGLTLTELSVQMDISKSTCLDTLRGLAARGFLIAEGGRYRLGPASYRLAGEVMASWSAPDAVRHYVRQVADKTGESVGFAVPDWEIGQVIYIEAINSTQTVHYAMRAGIRAPLYVSAAGRVVLAYAPEERTNAYLERARLRAFTPSTRATRESILEHLAVIREKGYCASFGEMLSDTAAIAVPVFGPDGRIIGALMVAAPLGRMKDQYEHLLDTITAAGRAASGEALSDRAETPPGGESAG
jgi:DNA-binding IclR family transcriptional regulator